MSSQYKENNFSTESFSVIPAASQNKITKPNIDHLLKRILDERKREKRSVIILVTISLSVICAFYFF